MPGNFLLVDHTLSRVERALVGIQVQLADRVRVGVDAHHASSSGAPVPRPVETIILGHMGEACRPACGASTTAMAGCRCNGWVQKPNRYPARRKIAEYFTVNFYLTTSGNFRTQTLIDAMLEIGADRILFSTDYPFEDVGQAATWFDAAAISEADRLKIGRTNAVKLFKLG